MEKFETLAEAFLAQYNEDDQQNLTIDDLACFATDHSEIASPIVFVGFARFVAAEYDYQWSI